MRDSSPETNTGPYLVCEKFEFGIFHCPCSSLGVSDGRAISDEYRTQTVRFRSYLLPVLLTLLNWSAQTNLADSEKKLKEIEKQNQKAERNCSDLFTWASTYKGASFERRQAILKQFIKEVRVGRDYNIEIVLNVPLDEFEEFKRHAASAGRGKNQKNKSQNPQKVGRCTSNAGIVVLDKTAGETISIVPKNAAHAILRC